MRQPVVLRIFRGGKLETVRQFAGSQLVIGRNSDVQLNLQDDEVALLHAMIEDRDGEYYVSDLGSQSGTFRNGIRVLEDKLESGDQLTVGPFTIQFYIGVPKPATPPTPAPQAPTVTPEAPPSAIQFSEETVQPATKATPPPPPAAKVEKTPEKPVVDESEVNTEKIELPESAPEELTPVITAAPTRTTPPPMAKKGTYAPPSSYKGLSEVIKPQKGSVVEVIVAWNDRVLSTDHFNRKGSVFISSNDAADVQVPIISWQSRYELLKIGTQATICLTQEMTGELIRADGSTSFAELARKNGIRNAGSHYELDLRQGEMVRIGLQNDLMSLYVRYVGESPKPLVAPILDMTSSEVTGVILALAVAAILGLYMAIYTPSAPLLGDQARIEEPIRKAIVRFTPPPEAKKVVEVTDHPHQKKIVVAKQKKIKQSPKPTVHKKGKAGRAAEVAPKKTRSKKKVYTSARSGGAIKTSRHKGANMRSRRPDPSKVGLLGVFASKGTQNKLDQAYTGSGELQGMAQRANGYAGSAENRAGDFGTKLKSTGAGGRGSSTYGISGLGTQGRGTGTTGYGIGGIGKKGSVQIDVGGQEASFDASMDKDAIRRVIEEHKREIADCYNRQLQRHPDLYGKLVLRWDIDDTGRVLNCIVKSNALGNRAVASCIMNRLKTWKFPNAPKDVVGRVIFPFVFTSQ